MVCVRACVCALCCSPLVRLIELHSYTPPSCRYQAPYESHIMAMLGLYPNSSIDKLQAMLSSSVLAPR